MTKVPDRKKLRQEYLRKKRQLNTAQIVAFLVWLPCFFGPLIALLFGLLLYRRQLTPLTSLATLAGVTVWALLLRRGWRAMRELERKERTLPYVPPMTVDNLPANEILVRGAEQPETPHREVLLRAARGDETPAAELLRANLANNDETRP